MNAAMTATAATQFDVGPLTWVKGEIDLALDRADAALQQYTAGLAAAAGDLTQIKFCRTHLHQVQGALTIVGLDGVTQFAEAVESLLDDLEQQRRAVEPEIIALAQQALVAIAHYLDELIGGQPNQPLRLLPLYREVQALRGVDRVAPSDLFFPDLNVRPPRRDAPARKLAPATFLALLRQERARFQRGLLAWLRSPRDGKGIDEMLTAVRHIEGTQNTASARSFWWVATGFFSALADGAFADDVAGVKQMCARIDLQIRRLLEGSKNVAERLLRDALYFVACTDSEQPIVQQVKDVYQLQALLPSDASVAPAPREAVRRKLAELISASEEAWAKYCSGAGQSLPVFRKHTQALADAVAQLEHTDFRRLAQAIAAAANWLSDDSSRQPDALAMEVATAILLAQNAQENFSRLGGDGDFAHQVDVTVARIHGCLAGSPPPPESAIPLLDEMSRKAQEKLLVGQVAKEIQSNFAQI
ncbi:MAG: Hpt domain-containing protein, partial [Propionivibrio sp.]